MRIIHNLQTHTNTIMIILPEAVSVRTAAVHNVETPSELSNFYQNVSSHHYPCSDYIISKS